MCKFLSAIVTSNGDIICHPEYTDSHEVLIKAYNLRTSEIAERSYVRVEFVPQGDYDDAEKYALTVDETSVPDWFESIRKDVVDSLKTRIKHAISVGERHKALLGQFAILRDWKGEIYAGRVFLLGNSQATIWGNSQATLWDNSQATLWDNSQATLRDNSQATLLDNSQATLYGNSQATLWGNSRATLWGNSRLVDKRPKAVK